MARAAVATKSKKKPADFKRPKRKVGRRAAPAANVTSVGITSRRINLLEQSLLQDKAGAAQLTHRRQALPELLQQTGHYNAHVRQRALQGLKELATQQTAANLRANASVLLERFLPTLLDEEAVVREAAVQAWKAMLPVLRSVLAPFATLVATYLCSGLTHLQVGVRQDALKAIGELVDEAPELLREDAGREVLARLLENFRDLICAAQTQGIRMMNTYDLLLGNDASKKAVNGRKSQKNNHKKSKKPKAPSGALALRFAALKVLHKLLQSVSTKAGDVNGPAGVRSASVPTTKALLLYPAPRLIDSGMFAAAHATTSAGEKLSASWQEKVRALLPALLDLWLESLEGSTDALSDVHVEHMKYIVECSTAVVGANTDLLNVDLAEDTKKNEFFQAALKLREELLAPESFPMLPSASATLAAASDSQGALSRWHGMNAALAKLACEYLRLPAMMRDSGKGEEQNESLEQRVCAYVVTTLAKYKETAELRAVASMQNVLQPLLEIVTLILASTSKCSELSKSSETTVEERSLLLNAVTEFYVLCTPKSVSFRSCTAFAVRQLEIVLRGQQRQSQKLPWPMVMKWVVCLADLLGQLDPQHMDLGRRSLLSLISVLKQLPTEFASGDQMDGVLTNLSAFFDLATVPAPSMSEDEKQRMMARTRFDALGAADQLAFVALVYHLPRYPVSLLRAFASCCKSPRIYSEAKSFLVDILFQRRDAVDLAHMVSFLVSTALAPVEANARHQRQQLHLVDHVCHTFVAMNLGSSLPKILAPTLAKAQAREEMNSVELHTLVLLYRTCVLSASTRSVETHNQRSDIPSEMERELVSLAVKVMVNFAVSSSSEQSTTPEEIDAREQERLLVDSCVSTLVLGETNVFAAFLNELLAVQQQVVTATRLRVLQALVRTSSLAGAFRRHQSHVGNLLRDVEQKYSGDDDDAQTLRQLRGDLELLAVGEFTDGGSKILFTKRRPAVAIAALGAYKMKPRSWIKTMAASSLLSPRTAFRKANSTPSSHTLSKVSIPLAMLTTLTRVVEFLDDNHFEEEGLYSKPGVDVECKDLLRFFRDQKLPDLTAYNPHSIASAVKEVLSNMYTPMISIDTSAELLEAVGSGRIDEATERKVTEIFKQIRSTTRDFLQVFLGHLNHISLNNQSRMSVTNLALHVGIALIRPTEDKTILSSKTMMRQRKCIAEFFIRQAASLPYDCATEMNIPAIPEFAPTPSIDPLESSSAPISLKQLHFVQVTWDAGESTFTPEKLEELFAKFGEIENLGINDQGNRAIIAYISAASAKEAECASIPFVRVRLRKPRQSEKRREYSPRSVKSISSDSHLNRDTKDDLPAKQAVTLLQQGTSSIQELEIPSSLAPEYSPLVHEPQPKVLDDSIIVEDIEDDEQEPPDCSSVMLATDLHFDDSKILSPTSLNDLQVTTDSNDADVGSRIQENDISKRLSECRSPNVTVTPVQAEQSKLATESGGGSESKLCLLTVSETKNIAQDIVRVAKEQDDDHDNVGDFPPTNERLTGSQQLAPETESSSENLPSDTLSAVSADRSQGKSFTNSVEPIEVTPTVVENYLDQVNGPGPIRHSLKSLEPSMKSIDPSTNQDELLTSADTAVAMDVLQSKLLDMDKILSTSTAALSMAKLSTEFEHAVLQLHNQILGLVADCLVLTGAKHGDLTDTSTINTAKNAEFLDFLEAQSKTQVKILEVEVRAGQELLRMHKSQFEKERIELEEEITALRVGRTEAENLCAELRSDLRKCRSELACHVANATDIQRQKSALEEKLVVSENQLHAREKALVKLQAEYEKMHRVAAEAQARVEKFKMGDFSCGKADPDNQECHSFLSSFDRKPANNIAGSTLQHVTKFMSKHAIRANTALETVPAEEKSPSTPEVLTRTSNVAALEAMKQRMTRDIQEQLASTRLALKEMEVCSTSGKTLEEEEEELRQLQKQFAARSLEMDLAMSESRAKLQELLSPAGHLSSHDDLVGFEQPKSNQEPTIFDSTALVNQLIAQAGKGSTSTFQKRWHHEDSAAEELFSIQHGDGVRNYQPVHEAQSSLYKKWTADRSRKMEKLASYRDKHAVLQAQKSMQTFQQTLAEMRGQR